MKPLIGIPCQHVPGHEENGAASACRQSYVDSIERAGGLPMLIPLGLTIEDWTEFYSIIDGLLLTGGVDVDPARYGEAPHPKLGDLAPERDDMEVWLVKKAFADNLPTLAICRGCQVMNVALGGTLYQDIPDQFPSSVNHSVAGEGKWTATPHELIIQGNSHLLKVFPEGRCLINSLHHQAVKEVGGGLRVSARSGDQLIEAIEGNAKRFFLGIQGHPEALWQSGEPRWLNIFKDFVESCK